MKSKNPATAAQGKPAAKPEARPRTEQPRGTTNKTKAKRATKSDAVIALLSRPRGATIDDMMKATGWQAHSVRGFLAGTVKKKRGLAVTSEAGDKDRIYRIALETQ